MNSIHKKNLWVILFAIAMGMFESIVVIYLRELFYPTGFEFPLHPIPAFIGKLEVFREAATIIILVAGGTIAGNSRLQRFAYFVLAFAIWDLFYYIFLYIFLSWPQSLFTWDILFLIPVPWVGPVWAPCLLCLLMIPGSWYVIFQTAKDSNFKISGHHWGMMIGGAVICILAFMWDYLKFISTHKHPWNIFSKQELFREIGTYIPQTFNNTVFFTGFFCMCASILLSHYTSKKQIKQIKF
ncbi:MAG: hypothetical protein ABIQ02_10990 [Saprospiraceae bacterium]